HELLLEHLRERLESSVALRVELDRLFGELDAAPGVLEVEPGGDLALRLIHRVADLLHVELGDDVERGHENALLDRDRRPGTLRRLGGRYPSGQRGQSVKLLRKLRWFESSPAHSCARRAGPPRGRTASRRGDNPARPFPAVSLVSDQAPERSSVRRGSGRY